MSAGDVGFRGVPANPAAFAGSRRDGHVHCPVHCFRRDSYHAAQFCGRHHLRWAGARLCALQRRRHLGITHQLRAWPAMLPLLGEKKLRESPMMSALEGAIAASFHDCAFSLVPRLSIRSPRQWLARPGQGHNIHLGHLVGLIQESHCTHSSACRPRRPPREVVTAAACPTIFLSVQECSRHCDQLAGQENHRRGHRVVKKDQN